ncbi:hypothetical protein GQ457_03G001440 [Hibiscus cannabinus]
MLGSSPLKGSAINEEALKENVAVEYQGVSRVTAGMEVKHSWAEIISKNLEKNGKDFVSPFEVMGHISPRQSELDLQSSRIGSKLSPMKGKLSWEASVDAKMNADYIKRGDANTQNFENFALIGSHSEEEEPYAFFPELNHAKKKKERRYGSLLDFQDKALSNLERKNRDRAFKRNKVSKKTLTSSELSGRSLSDSDLMVRWDVLTREARKTLKLGKSLGMKIIGDEEEVVRDIALLDARRV